MVWPLSCYSVKLFSSTHLVPFFWGSAEGLPHLGTGSSAWGAPGARVRLTPDPNQGPEGPRCILEDSLQEPPPEQQMSLPKEGIRAYAFCKKNASRTIGFLSLTLCIKIKKKKK